LKTRFSLSSVSMSAMDLRVQASAIRASSSSGALGRAVFRFS
jgi:hypothetical protein